MFILECTDQHGDHLCCWGLAGNLQNAGLLGGSHLAGLGVYRKDKADLISRNPRLEFHIQLSIIVSIIVIIYGSTAFSAHGLTSKLCE